MLHKIVYDVVFNPSKKWSRTGDGMIVIRASQGRKSVDIPTNIFCQSKQFSDGYINSLHPQFDGLNAMINQIMLDIQATEIEAFRKDINMTVQRLYSMYVEALNTSVPLTQFAENIFKYSSGRRKVTIDKYRDVLKNINEFSPDIAMEDIDLTWIKRYEHWMQERGNSESTVWARMKVVRMLFNEAIKRDLLKPWQTPFRIYEIPELRYRTDVLRFAEMEDLLHYRFEDAKLRRARDFFLLSCYTGLRYGDMIRLTSGHIRQVGEEVWLTMQTSKTGKLVQIPLTIIFYGRAMEILKKYKSVEELVKPFKWNTTINRFIHELFAICKIGGSQQITVHTARRSCVTALADFGVNIYTIQRVVGHARITTTQKYIQLSTATIEADLRKAFPKDRPIIIPESVPLPPEVEFCEAEEIN
jgi:site-specific recombinase XerD